MNTITIFAQNIVMAAMIPNMYPTSSRTGTGIWIRYNITIRIERVLSSNTNHVILNPQNNAK